MSHEPVPDDNNTMTMPKNLYQLGHQTSHSNYILYTQWGTHGVLVHAIKTLVTLGRRDTRLCLVHRYILSYTKQRRRLRSGISTIKYHTWPRTPYGKVTKHNKSSRAKGSALLKQVTTSPARNRQDIVTDIYETKILKRIYHPGTVSKKFTLNVKCFYSWLIWRFVNYSKNKCFFFF